MRRGIRPSNQPEHSSFYVYLFTVSPSLLNLHAKPWPVKGVSAARPPSPPTPTAITSWLPHGLRSGIRPVAPQSWSSAPTLLLGIQHAWESHPHPASLLASQAWTGSAPVRKSLPPDPLLPQGRFPHCPQRNRSPKCPSPASHTDRPVHPPPPVGGLLPDVWQTPPATSEWQRQTPVRGTALELTPLMSRADTRPGLPPLWAASGSGRGGVGITTSELGASHPPDGRWCSQGDPWGAGCCPGLAARAPGWCASCGCPEPPCPPAPGCWPSGTRERRSGRPGWTRSGAGRSDPLAGDAPRGWPGIAARLSWSGTPRASSVCDGADGGASQTCRVLGWNPIGPAWPSRWPEGGRMAAPPPTKCAPHWAGSCLYDTSDIMMSLVSLVSLCPAQDWPGNIHDRHLVSLLTALDPLYEGTLSPGPQQSGTNKNGNVATDTVLCLEDTPLQVTWSGLPWSLSSLTALCKLPVTDTRTECFVQ